MAAGEVFAIGPPRTRVDRLYDWGGGVLGLSLILVGLILTGYSIALPIEGHYVVAVLVWSALVAVTVLVVALVRSENRREVTGPPDSRIIPALKAAMTVWKALPADMRDAARPVIDKAFEVATVANGAEAAVKARLELLREFEAEAAERQKAREAVLIGRDDLLNGRAALEGFRDAREAGKPRELP